ncbi:MAG TPA: nucleoside deaminase [Tissierellales bacterium]|nr:nucleoside deaminase [Tissierellales bacterium]
MKRAIELAVKNVEEGGQPFGAVLVKDNQIIAEGVNELHIKNDISGHAELLAIRKAQEKLGSLNLSSSTMYASGHPCPMCLSAMYFSGIKNIYYSASLEDLEEVGMEYSSFIYQELTKKNKERTIVMKHIGLSGDIENPLKM